MDGKYFGIGIGTGLIIGLATAIFVAPKSGKETRKEIADKVNEVKAIVKEKHRRVTRIIKAAKTAATLESVLP